MLACLYAQISNDQKYYSFLKKKEIITFAVTWIHLEIITVSEVSQKKKDRYHTISLMCII